MTVLCRLTLISLLVVSVRATAGAATPGPGAAAVAQGTPTPTASPTPTGTRAASLIAIDNLTAHGTTTFAVNFDVFTAGIFAENLGVSGITFTPDPPGSWQTADATANPFGAPFQLLSGKILLQSITGTLVITFASQVNTFMCDFAVNGPRGVSGVAIQTYNGTTPVSSTSQLTTLGSAVSEGSINLSSATSFNKVRLSLLAAGLTPTATPTSGSGTGTLDSTRTVKPNTTPNPPGMTQETGGSGCSITAAEPAASPMLWALPFLILVACYRQLRRGGS